MKVRELIENSLRGVGITNPDSDNYQTALRHLNMIISNFSFWNPEDQPIDRFDSLDEVIQLPAYYVEAFEIMLAAREALAYRLPASSVQLLESKAKQVTDRLTYRRITSTGIGPSGMVI